MVLFTNCALAEERELSGAASDKVDAVLVLDSSGSMLVTDPLRLRVEGAKLFTQFLKQGDRLGIVSFAESASIVQELKDFSTDQQSTVNAEIAGIQNTGQYTNILEGVAAAKKMLQSNLREGANPAIILMSDGKMEPAPGGSSSDALTQELVDTVLPDLKKDGIKIYTLYFSDQADKDLLQEVAAQTDGINWFTPNADKIHESFADLFLAVKKPQIVPLTKKGFKIDADVQEATFYMNREEADGEISLIRPNGGKIDSNTTDSDVKWFSGQKFEVVTITAPTAGDWQINGVAPNDGFATVLTKLRLVTEWPSAFNAEEDTLLEARLYEDDKPIALPEMSGVIKYAYQITPTDKVSEPIIRDFLFDDGTHGDKIARDGIFSSKVEIQDPGEYKLRILAKAPTFERNQQIPFRVKPSLITLSLVSHEEELSVGEEGGAHGEHSDAAAHEGGHGDATEGAHEASRSSANDYLTVVISDEVLNMKKVSLHLYAVDEKRQKFEVNLSPSKHSKTTYEASAKLLPHDGEYKMQATLSAENKKGQEVKAQSRTLQYNRYLPAEEANEIQVVVPKKEEKPASPVIPIILMTLLNAGAAYGVFTLQKKRKQGGDEGMPTLESIDDLKNIFNELRARLESAEVDMQSQIFTNPDFVLADGWKGIGMTVEAAATDASSQSAPAPEAESAPEEAPMEEAPEAGEGEEGQEG